MRQHRKDYTDDMSGAAGHRGIYGQWTSGWIVLFGMLILLILSS